MEKLPGFTAEYSLSKTNGNYALGMKNDGHANKPPILPQISCGPCEPFPTESNPYGWAQYCCFGFGNCSWIGCPRPPCLGGWECYYIGSGICCDDCRRTNPVATCCRDAGGGFTECQYI